MKCKPPVNNSNRYLLCRVVRAPSIDEVQKHLSARLKGVDHHVLFELHANLRTLGMRLCHSQTPRLVQPEPTRPRTLQKK